jgi:hypothetical protein
VRRRRGQGSGGAVERAGERVREEGPGCALPAVWHDWQRTASPTQPLQREPPLLDEWVSPLPAAARWASAQGGAMGIKKGGEGGRRRSLARRGLQHRTQRCRPARRGPVGAGARLRAWQVHARRRARGSRPGCGAVARGFGAADRPRGPRRPVGTSRLGVVVGHKRDDPRAVGRADGLRPRPHVATGRLGDARVEGLEGGGGGGARRGAGRGIGQGRRLEMEAAGWRARVPGRPRKGRTPPVAAPFACQAAASPPPPSPTAGRPPWSAGG